MKKKKNSFLKKLFYTLIFGFSSVSLLGAWTYNNNTIQSNDLMQHLVGVGPLDTDITYTYNNTQYTASTSFDVTNDTFYYIDIEFETIYDLIYQQIGRFQFNEVTNVSLLIDLVNYIPSENGYNTDDWEYASIVLGGADFYSYSNGAYIKYLRNNTIYTTNNLFDYDMNDSSVYIYNGACKEIHNYDLPFTINDSITQLIINFYNYESMLNTDEIGYEGFQLYINTTPNNYYLVDSQNLVYLNTYQNLLNNYNTLQNNYNTLQSTYNTLQTNYTNLENDYSLLNTQYETLDRQLDNLQTQYNDLQSSYNQLQEEYEEYQDLINNTVGITSFDISQYSVSVGSVPNQPSFDYTLNQNLTNNFTTIGYLNISDIYTNYILPNNGSTNNTIYITTPQSNLLTFDLIFNYITQPNTMLKTTLTLPDGTTQQFLYSSTAYDYKEEWTLANLVSSTTIGANYNLNDISYKDLLITWENIGNNLSDIKIGSNNGFNTGFNNGYNTSLNKINELQQEINTKTSLLEKASVDLLNKTNEYNMLLARYQQVTETPLQLNFQNLIWTIASSPFESFKQIWNVDILGFNIANFVIGVMSVFVVMYIIKKIF